LKIVAFAILLGCDPVHSLRLENKTNKNIDVIYSPELDRQELEGQQATEIQVNGRKVNIVTLEPTKAIRIGRVTARYDPEPTDIHLRYLEIRFEKDTLKLVGRNAIFSTLQKVDKLDWRMIIRTK
jgi:hypothetical protein